MLETIGWKIQEVVAEINTNGTMPPSEPDHEAEVTNDTPETSFLDTSAEDGDITDSLNPGLKLPKLSITSEPDDNDNDSNNDSLLLDQSKRYIEIKTYEDKPLDLDGESPTNEANFVRTTTVTKVLTSEVPESAMNLLDDIKNSIDGIGTSEEIEECSPHTTVITKTTTQTFCPPDGLVEEVTTVRQESSLSKSADVM